MMMTFTVLGLIGGVLAVDQRAGWQGLVAQPVFAGGVVGLVLGELSVGLWTGLWLEVIYLSVVPMRGAKVSDQVAAGVVGAGTAGLLARLYGGPDPAMACAAGIFLGLAAGELGSRVTSPLFVRHNRFLSGVEFGAVADRGRLARRLFLLHASSVAFVFGVECVLVLGLSAASYYSAANVVGHAGGVLTRGAVFWESVVAGIGIASIIHLFWHHRFRNVLLVCAAAVVIILWLR